MSYTIKNLREIEDAAARFGLSDVQEARFAARELDAEATGLALLLVRPGQRQPFAHRHNQAEEVYVVLRGSGRVKLDDEIREVRAMDAIRVAPTVTRAFEAGPEGLELLALGAKHSGDAEMVREDVWAE